MRGRERELLLPCSEEGKRDGVKKLMTKYSLVWRGDTISELLKEGEREIFRERERDV